jgi:S1-C subfamily serine protease
VPFQLSQSREIGVAQELYAVGTPSSEQLSQTISKGIVSGKRKTRTFDQLIQTDAKINRGNSGGAMINKEGLVIGVATYKISGLFIEGIAFGIPAYEIFDRLKIKVE